MDVGNALADANAPAESARTNAVVRSTREMTVLAEFAEQKAKLLA